LNKKINTSQLNVIELPIKGDAEVREASGKGWTFPNIYLLDKLKDIYLTISLISEPNLKTITKKVQDLVSPPPQKKWTERGVLEYLNALTNFHLLNKESGQKYYSFPSDKPLAFSSSKINSQLTPQDILELKQIFLTYHRFNELMAWFFPGKSFMLPSLDLADALSNESKPVFYCSLEHRFTDTLFYNLESPTKKYIIPKNMKHVMRFWDVFLKWGNGLNLLEKFNLSAVGIFIESNKQLNVAYFTKPFRSFDLIDFARVNFDTRHIRIPDLIYKIATKYRFSVPDIKSFLVNQLVENERVTYERTSEIFLIKGRTQKKNIENITYLYPLIDGNYISHLILRK